MRYDTLAIYLIIIYRGLICTLLDNVASYNAEKVQ